MRRHSTPIDYGTLVSDDGALVSRRLWADPDVYEDEKTRIFGSCWLFLCHESQVSEPSTYFTTYMGEDPVVVARARDGVLRVFLNSCRHRGPRVCRADEGHASSFTCYYHQWKYGLDGRLLGVPDMKMMYDDRFDKRDWGLVQIAQVDTYKGLVFGCLDPAAPPLLDYLGEMTWYLDLILDRSPGGTEVLGAVQKWRVPCNWKVPAENQVGDTYHGPMLHASIIPDEPGMPPDVIRRTALTVSLDSGHGLGCRIAPEGTPLIDLVPGGEGFLAMYPETSEYAERTRVQVVERLGAVRANLRALSYNVFPTFSLLWPLSTLRVAHPKGPDEIEYWSWCIFDADAPEAVKHAVLESYGRLFGPAGVIEQDDGEAWQSVTSGAMGSAVQEHPYFLGANLGDEETRPEMPGMIGPAFSEQNARGMYKRWQELMMTPEAREAVR